jgi:hypothetical protein
VNKLQVCTAAHNLGFPHVHFQFNVACNTGREFEVGYVFREQRQVLFCKRQPKSSEDAFYLCNEFREYEEQLTREDTPSHSGR